MKILVVTSCTRAKKYRPFNSLTIEDFDNPKRLVHRTEELKQYKTSACEMYAGEQHRALMEGLNKIWKQFGIHIVDLYIISAGYGLLSANDIIVPYEVTFQGMTKKEILERSEKLDIHQQVESLVNHYNLVFFLLGREYVIALKLPLNVIDSVTQIFLLGKIYKSLIPKGANVFLLPVGKEEAKWLHSAHIRLKGLLFQRLCETACREGLSIFEQVKEDPYLIIDNALRLKTVGRQQTLWDNT